MDELAAMAAAYPPSELAYQTSGLLIATESNASTLNNDLNFENPEGDKSKYLYVFMCVTGCFKKFSLDG